MRHLSRQRNPIILMAYALFALVLSGSAAAAQFTWRDDPFSFPDSSNITPIRVGNSIAYTNFRAINVSPLPLSELGVIVPWIFPTPEAVPYSMEWSNALNGWVNNNYQGTSLLVTLDNVPGRLRFGDIAADSGTSPLDSTRIALGIAETRQPGDLVPFLDLGSFAPHQIKAFDLTFTFHFGDGRLLNGNAPFTFGFLNTISPIAGVPEPTTLALLGIGLLGLRRSRSFGYRRS